MAAWNQARENTTLVTTEFQRAFHAALVYSALHRDPLPQHKRMRPFNEHAYRHLLKMLEQSEESVARASARLLLTLLTSDAPQLPDSLVERLVRRLLVTSTSEFDELIVLFEHRRHLLPLTRLPWEPSVWSPAMTLDIARRADNEVQEHFASRLEGVSLAEPVLGPATVSPSMITTLRDHPHLLPRILNELAYFGAVAWEQIRPVDLLSAIQSGDNYPQLLEPVSQYLEARSAEAFDGIDATAMQELRVWVARSHKS